METRANHVFVGAVTLALLVALAGFFIWIARLGTADKKRYDVFFETSVGGLAKGSQVAYSGVPVGQVASIKLWDKDPRFVKVRIEVEEDTPILLGTTASISASFTGVSTIALNGGRRGSPPINCSNTACTEGVPQIPPQAGGLGEILASAPLLLERLASLTDRLSRVLSDENQASISGILANTDKISAQLADTTPEVKLALAELQGTLAQATRTLASFDKALNSTDQLINGEGPSLAAELRRTLDSARIAANSLQGTLDDTRPAAQRLSQNTLPAAEATLADLRRTSASLRALTEKLESQGAGALIGGGKLPDYKP